MIIGNAGSHTHVSVAKCWLAQPYSSPITLHSTQRCIPSLCAAWGLWPDFSQLVHDPCCYDAGESMWQSALHCSEQCQKPTTKASLAKMHVAAAMISTLLSITELGRTSVVCCCTSLSVHACRESHVSVVVDFSTCSCICSCTLQVLGSHRTQH